MSALWIAHISVTDPDRFADYSKRAGPAIAKHGGKFLASGGKCIQLEGQGRARNVVVRFDSIEAAEACYQSSEYQEAIAFARGASERDLVIVEELD
ncbi:DUF1330 domain-containing protein [Cohaesibacter celericrescens]|uniref:DUF1330 domain-containing protein n=1 Tax=Cohaesibacter celericrescens TaxID=2067669 RepID=A0A2N5XQ33_9HYPH|nr:DUF1330 domain-containing protein [Cohaesibacter celericrescens]PLW76528.1 DUF1330 domain-containing protein [Cohaesibacter celericrescens]